VNLTPIKDWNGKETLTFYANDSVFEISDSVQINITAFNDAPAPAIIVSPEDGFRINYGETLNFEGICNDPDLIYGDKLTFTWSSDIMGELGKSSNLMNYKLTPGKHLITLEVSDSEGSSTNTTIIITVLEKKASEDAMRLIIIGIIGMIIVILLIIILFVMLKRKREVKKKKEEATLTDITYPSYLPAGGKGPITPTRDQSTITIFGEPQSEMLPQQSVIPKLPPAFPKPVPFQLDVVKSVEYGRVYIIITKGSKFGLDIFEKLLEGSPERGMCITRTHPTMLKTGITMPNITKIWLSKTSDKDSVSPGNITKITHIISEFIKTQENGVILLDGLEYLINNNDFPRILKLLELLHEVIVLNNGVLLVPVNPSTLSGANFELLQSELTNTLRDPAYFAEYTEQVP